MGKQLKPKPVYGVDRKPDTLPFNYEVQKYDTELMEHVVERYSVYMPQPDLATEDYQRGTTCDCYAGLMGKWCRHKKMTQMFINAGYVGQPKAYSYDRKTWVL